MEENKRDIYNRFGDQFLDFDPRQDDLKLLSSVAATYVYWGVLSYVVTIPKSCKLCTNWILIALIVMLVLEVFLCLTESTLPENFLKYTTEHEFLLLLHCSFPFILTALRLLSEYLYIDLDSSTLDALTQVSRHQKEMHGLLQQLQMLTSPEVKTSLKEIEPKITELSNKINESDESIAMIVHTLKSTSQNPIANYYWLLFVGIYAGAYFLQ